MAKVKMQKNFEKKSLKQQRKRRKGKRKNSPKS
jgi:hypothetical protein